ncbi:hypothetical protein ACXR0O_17800 [Verrucomicrobiota bacterium sgz303538]
MNDELWRCVPLLLAVVVLPLGFFMVIRALNRAAVPSPPRFEFFTAFGTLGGWLLSISLSPSPLCIPLAAFTMFVCVPTALYLLVRTAYRLHLSHFHAAAMGALAAGVGIPFLVHALAA